MLDLYSIVNLQRVLCASDAACDLNGYDVKLLLYARHNLV